MLNISDQKITYRVPNEIYASLERFTKTKKDNVVLRLLAISFISALVISFIPWTQNIRSKGLVTAIRPDQRPQSIHSVIDGRIEAWFIQEGDFVKKGDTILLISEIKDAHFDPNLLDRTNQQLKSKELSVQAYMEKIKAQDNQIDALVETSALKIQQGENKIKQSYLKVTSDSIDLESYKTNYEIAELQYKRMNTLYEQGLKSLTDLEKRKLTLQKALAAKVSGENKLLTSVNEILNAKMELTSIEAQYRDDIAKAKSEKFSSLSKMYDSEAEVTKLQNQYMNYSIRLDMYHILAPQDGYITQAVQFGLGETIKTGEEIITIMPAEYDLAVEMYVKPMDLPLLIKGQKTRVQFDGWPAVVFSGWPNSSYGTFGGVIVAIDNFSSKNGLFRVLVSPDMEDHPWPHSLRIGGGTQSMVLLEDVAIWYELWRNINGFPPDFYSNSSSAPKKEKK
jgi:multidrug resistance efflux pump